MLCSNCGKDIPFNGNVCPWCHADKSGDQFVYVAGFLAGCLGFFVGNMVNGCVGGLIGMVVCMVAAVIGGHVFVASVNAKRKAAAQAKSLEREGLQKSANQTIVRLGELAAPASASALEDGDGDFEIVGVDKESGFDTTWRVHAMSPANAKVKAELEGIIVTSVKRLMAPPAATGRP